MPKPPYFELHIRPMFRLIDRDHMLFALDLFDYDKVAPRAKDIAKKLKQDMPTKDTGGPWPDEWIALFDRWVAAGCPRLALPTNVTYTLASDATLTAEGDSPDPGLVWFERNNENESPREYTLVRESASTLVVTPFNAQEMLPDGTTSVIVVDGDGRHEVKA